MIRSVLAILAGIVTLTVASFAIEAVANPLMMRFFPELLPDQAAINRNTWAALFGYAYTSLCVAGGGYVTAWVARRSPVRHAVIMGIIEAALFIPAMLANPDLAPARNWIIGMLLVVPAAWLGGEICNRSLRPSSDRRVHAGSL